MNASTPKKPREFWIEFSDGIYNLLRGVYNFSPSEDHRKYVHVIEKSAYDALELKIIRLKKELRFVKSLVNARPMELEELILSELGSDK